MNYGFSIKDERNVGFRSRTSRTKLLFYLTKQSENVYNHRGRIKCFSVIYRLKDNYGPCPCNYAVFYFCQTYFQRNLRSSTSSETFLTQNCVHREYPTICCAMSIPPRKNIGLTQLGNWHDQTNRFARYHT